MIVAATAPRRGVLPGVDRAAFAAALVGRLRAAGVAADLIGAANLVAALAAAPPGDRAEMYWIARITLVRRHSDLAAFDAVFDAVFADAQLPTESRGQPRPERQQVRRKNMPEVADSDSDDGADDTGVPWATRPSTAEADDDRRPIVTMSLPLPAPMAGDPDMAFDDLNPRDLEQLNTWVASALRRLPQRRSRRMVPRRHGPKIAMRATLARSRRTGFEPVYPVTVGPRRRARRIVVLCDVSASMQADVAAYLHLMRCLAVTADAEVFAFATLLTRLTPAMRRRSAAEAIAAAGDAVGDRFGGTRIAASLTELLGGRWGNVVRGAIVIIGSDGWDSEPPERIAHAMARLHRRAHRVIWCNPRASATGFAPTVSTMAAALPYCDVFLPGRTLAELAPVIAALGDETAGPRR